MQVCDASKSRSFSKFSLIHKMLVLWEIDLFSDLKGSSLIKVVMAPETIVVFSKAALVFFFNILHYPFSNFTVNLKFLVFEVNTYFKYIVLVPFHVFFANVSGQISGSP